MRARIHVDGEHWLWTGTITPRGYGRIELTAIGGKRQAWLAHRLVWHLLGGGACADLHHDGCPHKNCTNPACLSPMTKAEHTAAHAAQPNECTHGHPFTEANTYWRSHPDGTKSRQCRRCKADRMAAYKAAKR